MPKKKREPMCPSCKVRMEKQKGREVYVCPKCGRERDYELLSHIFSLGE
ncbi:MAG: hypothetical protein ACTSPB_01355 [Candidatus Thorarchaeota archaeon]